MQKEEGKQPEKEAKCVLFSVNTFGGNDTKDRAESNGTLCESPPKFEQLINSNLWLNPTLVMEE